MQGGTARAKATLRLDLTDDKPTFDVPCRVLKESLLIE